jgi:hypothetical protein
MKAGLQAMTCWLARTALVAVMTVSVTAWAQSGGSQGVPQPEPSKPAVAPAPADLEPGVNTSAIQPSSSEAAPAPTPAPSTPQNPPKPALAGKRTGAAKTDATGPASKAAAPATVSAASAKSGAPAGKAHDTIQLDTTQITGNRELPKVLYIVPWKRSDLGDLVGKPVNSLLDEVLTPVDRDVFKRQNRYYDALKPDAAKESAGAAAGPEKR